MWVCSKNKRAVEIDTEVVRKILGIYPEENLAQRPVFKDAFSADSIEFKDLKDESDKILIPWQFFLLDKDNFQNELDHINEMRIDKISTKLIAKRKGIGSVTSKRIIDRLIRLQNFICDNSDFPDNPFCGSLIGKTEKEAASHIKRYFSIVSDEFRRLKSKDLALHYLVNKIENKNINISQGVLAHKLLPAWQVVDNSIYKNTSGFVIKDDKVPFIFLPNEINPDEVTGRQIYTLIYLVTLIGLNEYNFFIERDFKVKAVEAKGRQARIFRITSELLLPSEDTTELMGQDITIQKRDSLSQKYKITPTAVLVILRMRKIITTDQYRALLPVEIEIKNKKISKMHSPNIETSLRKFCGKHPFDFINDSLKKSSISSIHAQYLLFGGVNKKGFKKYQTYLNI